ENETPICGDAVRVALRRRPSGWLEDLHCVSLPLPLLSGINILDESSALAARFEIGRSETSNPKFRNLRLDRSNLQFRISGLRFRFVQFQNLLPFGVGLLKYIVSLCEEGNGAVLERMTNLCGSVIDSGGVVWPFKICNRSRTVPSPISRIGWATVVSGGSV